MTSRPVVPQTTASRSSDPRFPGGPGGYDIVAFAVDFLKGIGAKPTPENVNAVVGWANAESSGYNPSRPGGKNNPLNIVRTPGDQSSGQGGSQGNIADFPTPAAGVAATVRFFNNIPGQKADIITAFRTNAGVSAIENAVSRFYGQWGASGFRFAGSNVSAGSISGAPTAGKADAQTTGISLPGIDWLTNLFPWVGPAVKGITAPTRLVLGLFTNWRYLAEVLIGANLVILGFILILKDMGALQNAGQAAAIGAMAA